MSDQIPTTTSAINLGASMTADAAAVQVRGVNKQFQTATGIVHALENIDLTVQSGEFVSLIGPSGCGKSTLMRLIADLDDPTSGELTVFGKTATQARLDQDYGIAFQQAGLLPWRSVAANVALPLELHASHPLPVALASPSFSTWWASPSLPTVFRISSRAACNSVSPSRGRWQNSRDCCSWMSPSERSMR